MEEFIDPKLYGLPASTKLRRTGNGAFEIVVDRKSRIIMKDGKAILDKANKIKNHEPDATVYLRTTAPVCGKTISFLQQNGIDTLKS